MEPYCRAADTVSAFHVYDLRNHEVVNKKPKKTDANEDAARVVALTAVSHSDPLPADLEAAWKQWSKGIQKVDARGMALLRAAFEAGAEAAARKR
jgi:hypothetical protein